MSPTSLYRRSPSKESSPRPEKGAMWWRDNTCLFMGLSIFLTRCLLILKAALMREEAEMAVWRWIHSGDREEAKGKRNRFWAPLFKIVKLSLSPFNKAWPWTSSLFRRELIHSGQVEWKGASYCEGEALPRLPQLRLANQSCPLGRERAKEY